MTLTNSIVPSVSVDMKNKQQNWQLVSLFYTFFM